jgi:hypothetical protein
MQEISKANAPLVSIWAHEDNKTSQVAIAASLLKTFMTVASCNFKTLLMAKSFYLKKFNQTNSHYLREDINRYYSNNIH